MIAVIIFSIFIIVGIVGSIILIKHTEEGAGACILFSAVMCLCLTLILCHGYSKSYKSEQMQTRKQMIELTLENDPSYNAIKEAENYNLEVDRGNDIFCRFSKEDRSEYKIDINKYLKTS